ncbi:MAG: type IV pilus assembly protein PilM [Acidimicrobiales bacterium]
MAQVVGLDIGTSAVRAAELDLSSTPPALVAYGQVGLPPGAIVDGEVQDVSAVADALVKLWHNGRFGETSVVIGLAGLRAITRELDLPFVPDDEVDSAVRFQSEEVIPFPAERTVFSTQVLADYTGPDGNQMRRVLVAAAHRDLVDGVIAAVERAGLQVEGIDLVSSALVRAVATPGQGDQPEAIVSVGAGLSVVVVHQAGRPQFVRTIATAGNAATAAISSTLDLPVADSEAIKRRLGEPTPQVQAAEKAVQASTTELVGEIRNSVQFFASLPGRAPISRLLVTGGGSRLRGFLDQLQAEVRLPVVPVSPLARLDTSRLTLSPQQISLIDPVLATPIGLALPESVPGARKFNLVPPEVTERAAQRRLKRYSITGAVAALVLIAAFSGWRYWQVHQTNNALTSLHSSVGTLEAEIPQYDPVVKATQTVQASNERVHVVTSSAVDWPVVLDELGAKIPAGLSITDLTATAGSGAPSGTSGTTQATTGSSSSTGATGQIGELTATCQGTGTGFLLATQWIDNLSTSNLFLPPEVPSVTDASGTVTFTSTVGITKAASLAHDPSYQ